MDTIESEWTKQTRIGNNIPSYDKSSFLEIEKYIIKTCAKYDITCKYNVGPLIGGVPPKGDNSPIVNSLVNAISYHDVMGGILISTRNAEINCRNVDTILMNETFNDISFTVLQNLNDKYVLKTSDVVYEKVLFIPGSNLFHTIDWEKLDEAMIDNPSAVIKLHPVITEQSANMIKSKWIDRVIDEDVSGLQLLNNASTIWTSYNSEFGLISSLKEIPFSNLSKWSDVFSMTYAPVYRNFKYKDINHNKLIVSKVLSSNHSGYVFPWQEDWKERIEEYFESIHRFKKGMEFPYA
jgi:hypothetical protein